MNSTTIWTALALYAILGTIVAVSSKKGLGKGLTEYFLANRSIGGFVGALTYSATTYSAFMMVGLAGFTYVGGVGALGFELIYLSGLVLAVLFGPRFWLAGKRFGYVTPSEMLSDRYDSPAVGLVAAVASLLFLVPYSAVQLMGIGYLVESLSDGSIAFMTAVAFAALLSVFWAYIAGMRSVAWTDSLQALVMILVAAATIFFVVERAFGGLGGLFTRLGQEHPAWLSVPGPGFFRFNSFVGLTVPWFFFCISNPQVSQRLFITKDLKSMRRMLTGFLFFGFIYTLVSVIWGLAARLELPSLSNPDLASPALLANARLVPPLLALLAMVGITAAAISTVDSIALTLSSMVAKDVYPALAGGKHKAGGSGEDRQLLAGKILIPAFAILMLLFARLRPGLISALSVASSAGLLVAVPPTIGAFFWRRGTAAGAVASMAGGGLTSICLQLTGAKPLGQWPGIWTLVASVSLFVLVSAITSPPKKKAEEFLSFLDDALKERNVI